MSDQKMSEKLDVIIFGASGFTGKYVVYEAVSILENLRWGIAGRDHIKLENVLQTMGTKANKNLSDVPLFVANINDESSLREMCKKCKVLINCCGPYRFFGEPVVKVCVETGTHYVDVSGEPQFMEMMQLKYNEQARENNTYVISACGFDSIPADLGVIFLEKNFDGIINSVEAYFQTFNKGSAGGVGIHYGTWESAIYGLAHEGELRGIRTQLYKEKLPKFEPVLKPRSLIFNSDVVNGVCLPFPGSDRSVVMRSQRFIYEQEQKRPVQFYAYIALNSWLTALIIAVLGVTFGIMTKFSLGRYLLLKYPKIFSLGYFSHEGPTDEGMQSVHFSVTLKAKGWPRTEQLAEASDQYTSKPSKSLMVQVSGTNPGYGATCVAILCSALTILREHDKMPNTGGVLPPGAAFAKTSIISELEKHERGMRFEIIANK